MAENIGLKVIAECMIRYDYKNTSEISPKHIAKIQEETKKRVKEWLENEKA